MDIQNHFYGHTAVYAGYCGMNRPRHVNGLIQHGWTPISPVANHFADLASRAPDGQLLAWTHQSRGWSPQDSPSHEHVEENDNDDESKAPTSLPTTAIGAPFLYLLDAVKASGRELEPLDCAVVFPFHGTRLMKVEGDQAAYARQIAEREGPSLVCLHIDDLQRPEVVDAWRQAGHELTTAGERRDPQFLARILWLILSARTVISNRLSTSLVYAAAASTPIDIFGPHFQIQDEHSASSESVLRTVWPEFYDPRATVEERRALADSELGRQDMRDPEELKRILGWSAPGVRPFAEYWLSAPVAKAQNILGLRQRPEGTALNETGISPLKFLRHPLEHLPQALPKVAVTTVDEPSRID